MNLYSALYISSLSLKHSDMTHVYQGDHTVLPKKSVALSCKTLGACRLD